VEQCVGSCGFRKLNIPEPEATINHDLAGKEFFSVDNVDYNELLLFIFCAYFTFRLSSSQPVAG